MSENDRGGSMYAAALKAMMEKTGCTIEEARDAYLNLTAESPVEAHGDLVTEGVQKAVDSLKSVKK